MSKRSIIYVDGFNLYYGAVKDTKWKWLDLQKYFSLLRQDDDVQVVKYFTAMIDGSHRSNQEAYLLALTSLPKISIILGKFKLKQVKCLVGPCNFKGSRIFQMPEEKRTDVNIAVHMLQDALLDRCDRLVLVSGDSDLAPALNMVKKVAPEKQIIVYVPAINPIRGAAVELRSAADKHRTLPNALLPKAQFPPKIPDGEGGWIEKPAAW
jgi:uncharacterized LabA/DUF88 family protein